MSVSLDDADLCVFALNLCVRACVRAARLERKSSAYSIKVSAAEML